VLKNTIVTSDFRLEVEICYSFYLSIIIGTVWSSGRYHVPQNVFLVITVIVNMIIARGIIVIITNN